MREVGVPAGQARLGLRLLVADHVEVDGAVDHLEVGVEADVVEQRRVVLADLRAVGVVVGVDGHLLARRRRRPRSAASPSLDVARAVGLAERARVAARVARDPAPGPCCMLGFSRPPNRRAIAVESIATLTASRTCSSSNGGSVLVEEEVVGRQRRPLLVAVRVARLDLRGQVGRRRRPACSRGRRRSRPGPGATRDLTIFVVIVSTLPFGMSGMSKPSTFSITNSRFGTDFAIS